MKRIKIITKIGEIKALIIDKNPKTASSILEALPIEGEINKWGDEIYFEIPVSLELENSQTIINKGDIAFWPPGNAFCIFFGLTPASIDSKIKLASAVNVFAKALDDVEILKKVKDEEKIRVELFINV